MTAPATLVLLAIVACWPVGWQGAIAQPAVPDLQLFFDAASQDAKVADRAMAELAPRWRNSYTSMIVDLVRFLPGRQGPGDDRFNVDTTGVPPPDDPERPVGRTGGLTAATAAPRTVHPVRARLTRFLERQTGQRFGDDLNRWREWMWKLPYEPHPSYMSFKSTVYRTAVDPRMGEFFSGRALVRLDEIDWGGVRVNGIPPLRSPSAIAADAASFMRDSHVVFGVVVNGAARAYPKRILAWHEMALDEVGGVKLTVVYCTLCGTVIPYRSVVGGAVRTFGTSGLLYRSNKLMFDEETKSLWSTLDGKPVVGPLAGSNLVLDIEPVVTTTWGEWRKAHPRTTVLSLDTGFQRDYSEGAAYREYFASDQLMFRVPRIDTRLKNKDEVLGVLLPAQGGGRQAVAFSAAYLAKQRIHHGEWEGLSLVVLTSARGANRIYDAGPHRFTAWQGEEHVLDQAREAWRVTEEALISPDGRTRLPRRAAIRAFWFGWYAQFPETVLVK